MQILKIIYKYFGPFIISVFALIISIIALCDSKYNFTIQNRAYLLLQNVRTTYPTSYTDDDNVNISFDIKNFGNTPCYKVNVFFDVNIFDSTFTKTPQYKNHIVENVIIGPNIPYPDRTKDYKFQIGPDIDTKLIGKKFFYFFYGKITYIDIFRKPHTTKFCYYTENKNNEYYKIYKFHNEIK